MIFAKFALDSVGRVQATNATPSGAYTLNGAAYMQEGGSTTAYPCITTDSVAAADGFIGGFRYTTAGALRVSDVSGGLPASSSVNQGLLMTDDGQLCFSTAAGTAVLNGVSVTADGAVSMSIMAFLLEFEDLGAGAVDTAVTFGGVSATFTRATTATTIGPTGLVISVASGVARSYYDPTSLAYLGYLAEGARTNLCLQSEVLGTTWTPVRSTVSTNATVSPDGAATADKIVSDATAAASHYITQAITYTNVVHTASVFLKAAERTWGFVNINDGTTNHSCYFNLGTGAVGAASNSSGSIKAYPNGWYRCSVTTNAATVAAAGALEIYIAEANSDITFNGNSVDGIFAWGVQLEAAAFASSYIPTTTAAVTRNADVLTYPTTGWYNAAAGTFMATTMSIAPPDAAVSKHLLGVDDGTGNERMAMFLSTALAPSFLVTDGGVSQGTTTNAVLSTGDTGKIAAAYELNNVALATNSGTVATDTSVSIPTVTVLRVAHAIGGGSQLFSPIRRVAYYNTRLPNAVLQRLTA